MRRLQEAERFHSSWSITGTPHPRFCFRTAGFLYLLENRLYKGVPSDPCSSGRRPKNSSYDTVWPVWIPKNAIRSTQHCTNLLVLDRQSPARSTLCICVHRRYPGSQQRRWFSQATPTRSVQTTFTLRITSEPWQVCFRGAQHWIPRTQHWYSGSGRKFWLGLNL